MTQQIPLAWFGDRVATGLRDVTSDLSALDSSGWWAVVVTFEGRALCARFDDVRIGRPAPTRWKGPALDTWVSSLDQSAYITAVDKVRALIASGDVYQVNVCRVLSAPMPRSGAIDLVGLAQALDSRNPAPHQGLVRLPQQGVQVVSASPELFLGRQDSHIVSRPIKGTAAPGQPFLPKDHDENVMIVDLVRNDLGRVCETGSVTVDELCVVEDHPGLSHLVSTISGELQRDVGWAQIMSATFPPGSVTGAPKSSSLLAIASLEQQARGPYCGAVGWVDADRGTAELAVGIRTFWWEHDRLNLGTGAGITWASDPDAEWAETELKAARLLAVASSSWDGSA